MDRSRIAGNAITGTGWSSHLVSFGSSTVPANWPSAAGTSTIIHGGDFTNDDPSTSPSGFGNADLAIDLGTQDTENSGLYPNATVSMSSAYAANTTGKTDSFSAVAIAGQLNGKYAIFVIGVDSHSHGRFIYCSRIEVGMFAGGFLFALGFAAASFADTLCLKRDFLAENEQ